jgi:hypothetical protein
LASWYSAAGVSQSVAATTPSVNSSSEPSLGATRSAMLLRTTVTPTASAIATAPTNDSGTLMTPASDSECSKRGAPADVCARCASADSGSEST